jgi:hypothetical protein
METSLFLAARLAVNSGGSIMRIISHLITIVGITAVEGRDSSSTRMAGNSNF